MSRTSELNVVVVGAGIVGACMAYQLSCQGARVTIVDAGSIASGVTATSFAWINTAGDQADPVASLRAAAIADYRRLEAQLPDLAVRWTGALSYGVPDALHGDANGRRTVTVSRSRILSLEPNLKHPPAQAVHAPAEGAVDAVEATRVLIAGAQQLGARLLEQTRVLGFVGTPGNVTGVDTTQGVIEADVVVLAAGTGITTLASTLGYPIALEASPAIFIRYRSAGAFVNGIISNAAMEVRQAADGSLLAAEDYLDETADNLPQAIALRTAEAIKQELHGVVSLQPEAACVGLRPIPRDGLPLVGYLPGTRGVYVCVMHPGVTLAPTVSRLASAEIVSGAPSPELRPCRLERFHG